jgi:hypothetical protein
VTGEGRCHINPVTPFPFGELRSRLLFLVRILFTTKGAKNHENFLPLRLFCAEK